MALHSLNRATPAAEAPACALFQHDLTLRLRRREGGQFRALLVARYNRLQSERYEAACALHEELRAVPGRQRRAHFEAQVPESPYRLLLRAELFRGSRGRLCAPRRLAFPELRLRGPLAVVAAGVSLRIGADRSRVTARITGPEDPLADTARHPLLEALAFALAHYPWCRREGGVLRGRTPGRPAALVRFFGGDGLAAAQAEFGIPASQRLTWRRYRAQQPAGPVAGSRPADLLAQLTGGGGGRAAEAVGPAAFRPPRAAAGAL
ncbi:MAG TPA: hypothetical protein DD491_06940 [Halieaceae bacterium]|nr:hypothetical protein [Halieaceae bacterium]